MEVVYCDIICVPLPSVNEICSSWDSFSLVYMKCRSMYRVSINLCHFVIVFHIFYNSFSNVNKISYFKHIPNFISKRLL